MTDTNAKPLGPRRSHPSWSLAQSSHPQRQVGRYGQPHYLLYRAFATIHYAYKPQIASSHPSATQALAEMLQSFSATGGGYAAPHRASRTVSEVIDRVIYEHLQFGTCLLEVHTTSKADEREPSTASSGQYGPVRLSALRGQYTRTRLGRVQHRVPDAPGWHSLNGATLVRPTLPGGLGRTLQTISRLFTAADAARPHPRDVIESGRWSGYDSSVHTLRKDEALAIVTSAIGWDAGGLFLGRSTSSHQHWRQLKFRRLWVQIATATIDVLNSVTSNPDYLFEPFSFGFTGIPTYDDLTEGMSALQNGTESVDEVRNRLLYPPGVEA